MGKANCQITGGSATFYLVTCFRLSDGLKGIGTTYTSMAYFRESINWAGMVALVVRSLIFDHKVLSSIAKI